MNTQTQQITANRLIRRGFEAEVFDFHPLHGVRVTMPKGTANVDIAESTREDVVGSVYRGIVIDKNRGRHMFDNLNLPQMVAFLNRWM